MLSATEVTELDAEDTFDNPLETLATIDTLEIDQLAIFVDKVEALVQGGPDSPEALWTLIKSLPRVSTKIGVTLTMTRILKYFISSSDTVNSDLKIPDVLQGRHKFCTLNIYFIYCYCYKGKATSTALKTKAQNAAFHSLFIQACERQWIALVTIILEPFKSSITEKNTAVSLRNPVINKGSSSLTA
jgi:hypothetical protein